MWVTTAQSTRAIPLAPRLFDLVVIDEASQCTLTNLLPVIYRAKRLVVIGDPKQLPAITSMGRSEQSSLAAQFGVRQYMDEFGHAKNDLYSVAQNALPGGPAEVIMLEEHYRSDPLVIGFANRFVYQQALKLRRGPGRTIDGIGVPGIYTLHVEGDPRRSGGSWVNEREARAVADKVLALVAAGVNSATIGVVTPFAAQKFRIQKLLEHPDSVAQVMADTAFGFQGDERDVIIFSAVIGGDSFPPGTARWVTEPPNLLNVALTRAKDFLYVVGNMHFATKQPGILNDLASYLRDVDTLRENHKGELALFSWMMMEGWTPVVHPDIANTCVSFALDEPLGRRVAVVVRTLTHIESPRTPGESARDTGLEAAGYRVVEVSSREVLETPTVVMHKIRTELRP